MARLGVNIDHVATLRNQRGESYPSIRRAAELSLRAGADQITIHLREDRRHIKDEDLPIVKTVTRENNKLLNLEVGTDLEIARIAARLGADWVCIVPEKREEKTTEGGLDLTNEKVFKKVVDVVDVIHAKSAGTKISLFVEASKGILEAVLKLRSLIPIHAVEIHTGDFAKCFVENHPVQEHIDRYSELKSHYQANGIGYHAGHGLTLESLKPLARNEIFEEYNIGHWIIGESIFVGLEKCIHDLKSVCSRK